MSLKRPKLEPGLEPEPRINKMENFTRTKIEQFKQKRLGEIMDIVIAIFHKNPKTPLTKANFIERLEGYDDFLYKPMSLAEKYRDGKYQGESSFKRESRLSNNPNKELYNKWKELQPTTIEQKIVFQQLADCGFLIKTANNEIANIYRQRQKWKWTHLEEDYTSIRNFEW